ncbi:MAG: polysaccharide deacetylase [Woeseiaceae bacterium]
MRYEFSPINARGQLRWPNGAKVALIVTANMEYWDLIKDTDKPYYAGGPSILPDLLPGNVPDFPNFSWREYGQRVGIWRLFNCFDKLGLPLSCTMNAKTAQEVPQIVEAVLSRGWELVAHNYEQGELLTNFAHDRSKESSVIQETLKVYQEFVGKPAMGWLSSSLRGTLNTCDIIAENGLIFYCDIMNDDQPYLIETDSGPIVSIPYSNEINDFTLLTRRAHTNSEFVDILKCELQELLSEASESGSGRLMNLGLHPHVSGRAYRTAALREFLTFAKSQDGVWFATREEIAKWYLDNHVGHIVPRTKANGGNAVKNIT